MNHAFFLFSDPIFLFFNLLLCNITIVMADASKWCGYARTFVSVQETLTVVWFSFSWYRITLSDFFHFRENVKHLLRRNLRNISVCINIFTHQPRHRYSSACQHWSGVFYSRFNMLSDYPHVFNRFQFKVCDMFKYATWKRHNRYIRISSLCFPYFFCNSDRTIWLH